ncbi:hypothetical protein ACQP1P_38585 [Dactylosporangium sp. CA-052675]|uniref:hypothetical protein n=1 Tax=Dactylosporangium sp. CA-052675 TaxID=3239927 RepID=UPI003D913D57
MADLFTPEEFASYLQQDVDTSSAIVARRVASGWLLSATGLTSFTTVDDRLFAWGLELAAIAYRNPDGAASESVDDHNVTWDRQRRKDILTEVRTSYGTSGQPSYSFPDPDWHWTVVPAGNQLTT